MASVQTVSSHTISKVVMGVLANAEAGELPLFTWTLGLPFDDWHVFCGQNGEFAGLPPATHKVVSKMIPKQFDELVRRLLAYRSDAVSIEETQLLARSIAAASFGSQHLWQDMGLSSREELNNLLRTYFSSLFLLNTRDVKWKKFILFELIGQEKAMSILEPNCKDCDGYQQCFGYLKQ